MATDAMKLVPATFDEYALETSLFKGEKDWQCSMRDAENRGKKEASFDIARKMKYAGRPFNEIIEFTGLSTETIAEL